MPVVTNGPHTASVDLRPLSSPRPSRPIVLRAVAIDLHPHSSRSHPRDPRDVTSETPRGWCDEFWHSTRLLSTSIEARRRPRRSACNRPQSAAAQCSERKTKTSVSHRTDETEVNAILEDGYSRVNKPPATEVLVPDRDVKTHRPDPDRDSDLKTSRSDPERKTCRPDHDRKTSDRKTSRSDPDLASIAASCDRVADALDRFAVAVDQIATALTGLDLSPQAPKATNRKPKRTSPHVAPPDVGPVSDIERAAARRALRQHGIETK